MGWSMRRYRGSLGRRLVGAGLLLVLASCSQMPPPDVSEGLAPAQESRTVSRMDPPARVLMRYHEFFDATVVEYRAATSAWLTFVAYYTTPGRTPSGPPDSVNIGCIVHPDPDHRGQGEGARLVLQAEGHQVDLGELRYTAEALAESYWLERVSQQTLLPLLSAARLSGSCAGLPFQLSPAQWATFQAFVAGSAAVSER